MILNNRDLFILRLVYRFRFCLGRHIKVLAGFSGLRATDRRLRALVDGKYLMRKKYMYGVPYLYTLTHKGRVLLGVNKRADVIRVDRIFHDIYVLDAVIFCTIQYGITLSDIVSDKEKNVENGFKARSHNPDFIATIQEQRYAIEIELTPKSKIRTEKIIRDNYLNYDYQVWITNNSTVIALINSFTNKYSNIKIYPLEGVIEHVRK